MTKALRTRLGTVTPEPVRVNDSENLQDSHLEEAAAAPDGGGGGRAAREGSEAERRYGGWHGRGRGIWRVRGGHGRAPRIHVMLSDRWLGFVRFEGGGARLVPLTWGLP